MDAPARGIHRRIEFTVTPGLSQRFLRMVNVRGADECWEWLGAKRNGYGAIKHNKQVLSAHVVAFVIHRGPIPEGRIVCHSCDNRICCNPKHLQAGTFQDNNREARERVPINYARGTDCEHAKMTEEIVTHIRAVRQVLGWGARKLSRHFPFAETIIDSAMRYETWKHVPRPSRAEAVRIVSQLRLHAQ